MADTLVSAVVHIDEKRFPLLGERRIVDRESVVLRSDETVFCPDAAHRLIVAFSLYVFAPAAFARSWLPMQIPHIGLPISMALRILATVASAMSGLPGPFEINSPS